VAVGFPAVASPVGQAVAVRVVDLAAGDPEGPDPAAEGADVPAAVDNKAAADDQEEARVATRGVVVPVVGRVETIRGAVARAMGKAREAVVPAMARGREEARDRGMGRGTAKGRVRGKAKDREPRPPVTATDRRNRRPEQRPPMPTRARASSAIRPA